MRGFLYILFLTLTAAACGDVNGLPEPIASESVSLSRPANLPAELKIPEGHELALVADAEGAQVYVCQPVVIGAIPTWTLERPDALLFGRRGRVVAHHYEGPTWEALDGSAVVGKRLDPVYTPDPSAIPWLLLQASSTKGDGLLSEVTYIQRLHTEDGLAPQTVCDDANLGAHARRPYTATYYFYRAATSGHYHQR